VRGATPQERRIIAALVKVTGLSPAELEELRRACPDPSEAMVRLKAIAAARGNTLVFVDLGRDVTAAVFPRPTRGKHGGS